MSAKIESQPIEKATDMDKVQHDKSSTSATDKENSKENSTKRTGTHIWVSKDPWSKPGPKPSKTKKASNSSAKIEKDKKGVSEMRYQPKLMLEEDLEKKTVLIKIGGRTSIR